MTILLPWIGLLLSSAPAAPTMTANVPLRAHILEMEGIQWRADLLDGLEYVGQADDSTIWKADAATLRRLVDASASCRPAGTAKGLAPGGSRVYYVASLGRIAQVSKGRTTSLAFKPAIGNVLDGVELDLKGVGAPGGVLADVTIRAGHVEAFHQVGRREEVGDVSSSTQIVGTLQVPEVFHATAGGRWLIPAGGAIVVGLGVRGHSNVPWGREPLRERVVVIDAGDVPASVYARTPRTAPPSWVGWLPVIGWPATLTGSLGAAFLAGWFAQGNAPRARTGNPPTAEMGPIADPGPVDDGPRAGSRRPPTLADAMALVAGTAVACLVVQTSVGPLDPGELWDSLKDAPAPSWTALNIVLVLGELWVIIVVPLLAAWSATLAMVVICVPRTDRSRRLLRPGVMSCLQVGLVVALAASLGLARSLVASRPGRVGNIVGEGSLFVAGLSGLAVAGCWLTMVLLGAWRPEPSWADRLGRLLGAAWIATLPFVLIYAILLEM